MTITISWWHVVMALLLLPIVHFSFYSRSGSYDFALGPFMTLLVCWSIALTIMLIKWIGL